MLQKRSHNYLGVVFISLLLAGCKTNSKLVKTENKSVPQNYGYSQDSTNTAKVNWKTYFSDPDLTSLIDSALKNNQELNITLQEIIINKNEIRARKGEYLPFVGLRGGAGFQPIPRYTWQGAVEDNVDFKTKKDVIESISDYSFGLSASWEIDIWKKLRNAKKSAVMRYLSSIEGKNFMVTNLVKEIANSYYELMALDNQLDIVEKNIEIQSNALQIVKQERDAAKLTQLAVNRFEAQLLNTINLQYEIKQNIIETENMINFLTGRFPQPVKRNSTAFINMTVDTVYTGIPSQLLSNRTDIKQAELQLVAAKLDVKVARANFYPSFRIQGGLGFQAFNPAFIINPYSILYSLAGDLMAPLINRNGIKATYYSANAKQVQAVYNYERTILQAYIDVVNQQSRKNNFSKSYYTKAKEVDILAQSITISNNLFRSARADYIEVLLTQREALASKMELIEIKMKQMNAKVGIYQALGGGWK